MLILLYHNVLDVSPEGRPVATGQITLPTFRDHLRRFRSRLISPEDAADQLRQGRTPRGVLITFDDAAAGVELAARELAAIGAAGVCFTCPGAATRAIWFYRLARILAESPGDRLAFRQWQLSIADARERRTAYRIISPSLFDLSPAEREEALAELSQQCGVDQHRPLPGLEILDEPGLKRTAATGGMWFANHSWSHPNLTALSDQELTHEVDAAADWLEASGLPVLPWFAFPRGSHDARVRAAVSKRHSVSFGAIPLREADGVLPRTSLYEVDANPLRLIAKTALDSAPLRWALTARARVAPSP